MKKNGYEQVFLHLNIFILMSRLLDPAMMMALKNLQLAARTTIDGLMAGINKSKVKGPGLEFSQYRSYEPGDDLRWLDWKLYARSDRYYIRESEIETSIFVRVLVDASASMLHNDNGFQKIEYARYLAASLAWLAHQQTDGIGLYVFQDSQLFALPVKKDHQHFQRLCFQLENIQPGGKFEHPTKYKDLFSGSSRRELLLFVTDFYQHSDELFKMINILSALRHEILVFHVMGKNEMEMNFEGFSALQDLETGTTISFDNAVGKQVYLEKLEAHINTIRKKLAEKNISYRLMRMDQPLELALKDFLKQRHKINI